MDTLVDAPTTMRNCRLVVLEILHLALVLFCGFHVLERSQVSTTTGFRVSLDRVKTIFARFQFADHVDLSMLMWRMRHGDFTARRHDVGEQLLCQTAGRRHGASSTLADRGSTAIGKSCKLVHWCPPCAENFSRR